MNEGTVEANKSNRRNYFSSKRHKIFQNKKNEWVINNFDISVQNHTEKQKFFFNNGVISKALSCKINYHFVM